MPVDFGYKTDNELYSGLTKAVLCLFHIRFDKCKLFIVTSLNFYSRNQNTVVDVSTRDAAATGSPLPDGFSWEGGLG